MGVTTGSVGVILSFADAIPTGPTPFGDYTVLDAYAIPVTQAAIHDFAASGTGPLQFAQVFTFVYTSSVAVTEDLTTVATIGGGVGLSHVRALWVENPATDATHVLKFGDDAVETNLFLGRLGGTHPQVAVQAGTPYVDAKPAGATGYVVDGTHRNLRFDPGGVSMTWTLVVLGD